MPFEAVQESLAAITGWSLETAGFVLGMIVVFVLVVIFMIISSLVEGDFGFTSFAIGGGVGTAFVSLVGWWPLWTVIFIALLIVFVIVNPWGRGSSSI